MPAKHLLNPRYAGKTGNYRAAARIRTLCNAWPLARFVTTEPAETTCKKCLRLWGDLTPASRAAVKQAESALKPRDGVPATGGAQSSLRRL